MTIADMLEIACKLDMKSFCNSYYLVSDFELILVTHGIFVGCVEIFISCP